jgi:hypothetical protein
MRSKLVIGLALALPLGVPGVAAAALPVGNLLQNPGGERGQAATSALGAYAAPSWQAGSPGFPTPVRYGTAGGFPSADLSAAIGGEQNFFAGGPPDKLHGDPDTTTLTQVFDIPPTAGGDVDGGNAVLTLGGCLGGYATQPDGVSLGASFTTGPNGDRTPFPQSMGVSGPTAGERGNQTTLLPRSASVVLPYTTREITVTVSFSRPNGKGTYNDGYADNLMMTLTAPGDPTPAPSCSVPSTGGGGAPTPGGPTPGGPPGGGPPRGGPFLLLQGSSSARLNSTRSRVGVPLTCGGHDAPCEGIVSLTLSSVPHASSVKLGSRAFSIPPGATKTVQVRLARIARKKVARLPLRQMRRLQVNATVRMSGVSKTFRLRLVG